MERDFLGWSWKHKSVDVEEEITDGRNDSAASRAPAMQWSFSNKASALPQVLSFKATQDDGPRKTGFDSLASTGYMTISSSESLSSNHGPYSTIMQKNLIPDNQAGMHYTVTNYPAPQFNMHSRIHEVRTLPIANPTNQRISITMSTPANLSVLPSAGQNVISSGVNPQPFGGVPVVSPISVVPVSTSVVGTTDLRNASKPSGGPAQLTIFYAGSVCVYDDVSPEKAQAIMLLAGNGNSASPHKSVLKTRAETPVPTTSVNGFIGSQSVITSPCPVPPSSISVTVGTAPARPISVTSCAATPHPISLASNAASSRLISVTSGAAHPRPISVTSGAAPPHSISVTSGAAPLRSVSASSDAAPPRPISATSGAVASASNTDMTAAKAKGTLTSTSNKPESSKGISSPGPVSAAMIPSAVPQARKASLARFLEKRKERAMSASPYPSKQSPDCSTPGSDSRSISMNTSTFSPLPAFN